MGKLTFTRPLINVIANNNKDLFLNQYNGTANLWQILLLVFGSVFVFAPAALAQKPAASLEQIRNGSATSPTEPAQWQNGNAGNQTAHYVEGHSIGYRALITNITAGQSVTITLGYDITHSSKNAIDFLTHYDRLQPHGQFFHTQETVDPRLGTSFAGSSDVPSTREIPQPYQGTTAGAPAVSAYNAIDPAKRVMTMWGGVITNIAYITPFANTTAAQAEQQISVTFTMGSSGSAVLAWGGHIANRQNWGSTEAGIPLSAGGISGSPYHMRLIGWSIGNLGQQDRSLSAAAVIAPPGCALTGGTSVCAGSSNIYSTTEVADSYAWTLTNSGGAAAVFNPAPTSTSTSVTVDAGANAGSYTVKLVTTRNGITSTDNCEKIVTVTKPIAPAVAYNAPACDQTTFSLTIGSVVNPVISGAIYTVLDKNGNAINGISPASPYTALDPNPINFTNIPAGSGYRVTVTINGCASSANACPMVTTSNIPSIQSAKAPESNVANIENTKMTVYPIPFTDKTTIEFKSAKDEDYVINLYNLEGQMVRQLKAGKAKAGEVTRVEVDGRGMAETMYLARKESKLGISTIKLLKKR